MRSNPAASPDGLQGSEGTFSLCTFAYVDALAGARRLDDARLTFEKMLTYANHVGLYSEEIALTGDQIGNFPQAFTHLVGAAPLSVLDPAPWARSQMAFTLGFHIVLVPLGVSWALMALIELSRDQAARRGRFAVGGALVEVHGGDVRGGRGHRDGADVRVRLALAAVHGPMGRGV